MTDDVQQIARKRICGACVGDKYLKGEIRRDGKRANCSYCGNRAKAMRIGDFAGYINQAFEDHFDLSPEDYYPDPEPSGDPVSHMIQEAALIDEPPAEDVRLVLEARSGVGSHKDTMYDQNPFSEEAYYQQKGVRISEYLEEWQFFRKGILSEARLFNRQAEAVLARIFEGMENHATRRGRKIIVEAGPGKKIAALYRARYFQSDDEKLEAAISRPDRELGPPPPPLATAGRMNSSGIGVFYGATHPSVALAEIRPPVGSRVLVGRFEIIRPLRLLDLDAMGDIEAKGSIFEPSYARELEKAAFLWTLSEQITRPVMPDDEASEYLVTQAIADYLATRDAPVLDGIIYPSAQQSGKLKRNVVLFHKSARVEDLGLPKHARISAQVYEQDEDGTRPDYRVSVTVPPGKKGKREDAPRYEPWDSFPDPRRDSRDPALRVDLPSLKVHHINSVSFGEDRLPVVRREYEMSATEFAEIEQKEKEDFPF